MLLSAGRFDLLGVKLRQFEIPVLSMVPRPQGHVPAWHELWNVINNDWLVSLNLLELAILTVIRTHRLRARFSFLAPDSERLYTVRGVSILSRDLYFYWTHFFLWRREFSNRTGFGWPTFLGWKLWLILTYLLLTGLFPLTGNERSLLCVGCLSLWNLFDGDSRHLLLCLSLRRGLAQLANCLSLVYSIIFLIDFRNLRWRYACLTDASQVFGTSLFGSIEIWSKFSRRNLSPLRGQRNFCLFEGVTRRVLNVVCSMNVIVEASDRAPPRIHKFLSMLKSLRLVLLVDDGLLRYLKSWFKFTSRLMLLQVGKNLVLTFNELL